MLGFIFRFVVIVGFIVIFSIVFFYNVSGIGGVGGGYDLNGFYVIMMISVSGCLIY